MEITDEVIDIAMDYINDIKFFCIYSISISIHQYIYD
jgi:hypothetical protein